MNVQRRVTDSRALQETREDYWHPKSPNSIRKAGEDFRLIRRETKEKY